MKKIYKDAIVNIDGTDEYDQIFSLDYATSLQATKDREIIYMRDLLEKYKNEEISKKVKEKPAMWSEVYSPKNELALFTELFEKALKEKKKIHIIWITLGEEIEMLERYYEELGCMREDINAFEVDFSLPLVTVSCHIENLIWKWSDYKSQWSKIFFCPPIRESGQNKALFKGITRGVIAGIELWEFTNEKQIFIGDCIRQEKILPIHMAKVLKYNLEDMGILWGTQSMCVSY